MAVEPPIYLGPTWQRDEHGKFILPQFTLGWEAAGWTHRYLLNPNDKEQAWTFTQEQLRLLLWWYAIDERGEFVYRKGVLQRLKGWGKDPFAAVLALIELVGPCRFSHWETDPSTGEVYPVAMQAPASWVQVVAVSRDQTRNTMTLFPALISDELKRDYDLDMGIELIRAEGHTRRIEAVTSSYRALEGGRSTFVILNEIHHFVPGNQGDRIYETVDGNTTKIAKSRYLAITNAYLPGEDSVAERIRSDRDRIEQGLAVDVGLMYDSIEAAPETDLSPDTLREVIPLLRGDAVWLDPEAILASIQSESIPVARSRRMWLNQIVASEDGLYTAQDLNQLVHEDAALGEGDRIVLGFDGSKTRDATALIAIRLSDGLVEPLRIWERPHGVERGQWEVDRDDVDSWVHKAHRIYDVRAFFADVYQWEAHIAEWNRDYGSTYDVQASPRSAIGWDMRGSVKRITQEHEHLMSSILNARLILGAPVTALRKHFWAHILNANRKENIYGVSFNKASPSSNRKIDAYAALLAGHVAYTEALREAKPVVSRRSWAY